MAYTPKLVKQLVWPHDVRCSTLGRARVASLQSRGPPGVRAYSWRLIKHREAPTAKVRKRVVVADTVGPRFGRPVARAPRSLGLRVRHRGAAASSTLAGTPRPWAARPHSFALGRAARQSVHRDRELTFARFA